MIWSFAFSVKAKIGTAIPALQQRFLAGDIPTGVYTNLLNLKSRTYYIKILQSRIGDRCVVGNWLFVFLAGE